jgi:hypothetical protein
MKEKIRDIWIKINKYHAKLTPSEVVAGLPE